MAEYDLHHAVLLANLILDRAVTLHTGCEQLSVLLERLGMARIEPYRAISEAAETNLRPPAIPYSRHHQSSEEDYARNTEEFAAFNRAQHDVFAACRALVQQFGEA
ncbi:MAG: hypothetical protein AB7G28_12715 [Pirellulales bacterium]